MSRAPQKRKIETHDRLLTAARSLSDLNGYDALRMEEVALKAGVAKGTVFSHFADKDRLLSALIGADLHAALDQMEQAAPTDPRSLADAHEPLFQVAARDRVSFDIILRYSGAALETDLGPITQSFGRHMEIVAGWLSTWGDAVRKDIDLELQAEGVQAFMVQVIALNFCALHSSTEITDRFETYLSAWLTPAR